MSNKTENGESRSTLATGSGSWTPLHIELMIHYCCSCSPFPRADAPAVIDYTRQLIECGLVEETADDPRRNYRATPMGEAFLELVCRTPLPRLAWVAPTGEVIAYSPNVVVSHEHGEDNAPKQPKA